MKRVVIYNPFAGNGRGEDDAKLLEGYYGAETLCVNMVDITDYEEFFSGLTEEDQLIICGGDGTLNRFVNDTDGLDIPCRIFYHACGTGNDFVRDIDHEGDPIDVTEYIKDLPAVTVNGKSYKFLNNVGFGIDGYCCEVGDAMKNEGKTDINYTAIAIKGLLFGFKPRGATVTVDGVKIRYENVWLAPTMKGRFYGGGMMPTPKQDRKDPEGKVSVMVMHKKSKLKTLTVFPSIFKGEHIKHTDMVTVLEGNSIKVCFDIPAAVQIDGETVLNVTEYEVFAGKPTECGREEIHKGYDTALI